MEKILKEIQSKSQKDYRSRVENLLTEMQIKIFDNTKLQVNKMLAQFENKKRIEDTRKVEEMLKDSIKKRKNKTLQEKKTSDIKIKMANLFKELENKIEGDIKVYHSKI